METLRMTRRTFLKACAVTGAVATVFSPDEMSPLKGLVEAAKPAGEAEEKVFHSGCRACHINCPVLVTVRDGRVVKVMGEMAPPNFGRCCLRAMGCIQWLYSPTRVKYPLKRVGKRGEGKWQRISWDQGLDEVAAKLMEVKEKYGAESITFPGRTGRHDMSMMTWRLAYSLGTPNYHWGTDDICYCNRLAIKNISFGGQALVDSGASALRVNWGIERSMSHTTLIQHDIVAKFERGQKVICVDPIFSRTAAFSDLWLPIRPGTDSAMMLAWINIIISENLYDADFVKKWTNGPFLAKTDETSYKVAAKIDLTSGEDSFGEIKQRLGDLLTEADIVEGGSAGRYLFWNEPTNDLKYWDADEICWEGGASGKPHFDALAERCHVGQPFLEPPSESDVSPASEFPPGIDPALLGTYTVTLKDGTKVECKPVFQHLADIAAEYTPQKAEEITWVPKEKIVEAARMFGTIKPASIDDGVAFDQHSNSSQVVRAQCILHLITGNFDNAGGYVTSPLYPVTSMVLEPEYVEGNVGKFPPEIATKRLGYYDHPVMSGAIDDEDLTKLLPFSYWHPATDAAIVMNGPSAHVAMVTGKPYPLKAQITISSNPLMHDCNINYYYKGLKQLDHHVAIDIVMTPTCEMADYVFPGLTWFERPYINGCGSTFVVSPFGKTIEPLWESRHDYEFVYGLAKRIGREEDWKEGRTQEEWYDFRCRRDLGISWKELVSKPVWTPPTPPPPKYEKYKISGKLCTYTGKTEIYSTIFKKWGFPPILAYVEGGYSPYSQPDMAKEYPLVLTTGKSQRGWFHSEFRMVPWLREIVREPWLSINPDAAAPLGIKDGDWVWVESPVGRCMGKAQLYEGLHPGVVVNQQHAWWRPEKSAEEDLHGAFEFNIGLTIQTDIHDPETGGWSCKSQLCKVYKASPEDVRKYKPDITLEQLKALMPLKEV